MEKEIVIYTNNIKEKGLRVKEKGDRFTLFNSFNPKKQNLYMKTDLLKNLKYKIKITNNFDIFLNFSYIYNYTSYEEYYKILNNFSYSQTIVNKLYQFLYKSIKNDDYKECRVNNIPKSLNINNLKMRYKFEDIIYFDCYCRLNFNNKLKNYLINIVKNTPNDYVIFTINNNHKNYTIIYDFIDNIEVKITEKNEEKVNILYINPFTKTIKYNNTFKDINEENQCDIFIEYLNNHFHHFFSEMFINNDKSIEDVLNEVKTILILL